MITFRLSNEDGLYQNEIIADDMEVIKHQITLEPIIKVQISKTKRTRHPVMNKCDKRSCYCV